MGQPIVKEMTRSDDRRGSLRGSVLVLTFLFLFSLCSLQPASAQDSGAAPEDIWSDDYANMVFPWSTSPGIDRDQVQFKSYHDYFTMKARMEALSEQNPEFITFHEGMPGGENARDQETTADTYEGWYYAHSSPWVKITKDPDGGTCNAFVGDCGNYEDRPDVMLVGNHHAREWMSYEVPMLFLETVAYYYGTMAIDNDGDGRVDEDPWGDADGDGVIDDDGDCLSLNTSFQDSNGDGLACGPGDLGVDEDFSEEEITRLVDTREIYLIPMLNVDGNRYDREVFCPDPAWETCSSGGWRKNLRNNGPEPLPDATQQVDEDCDGVDLNRNYQFEWGWPLGATVPLIPGTCTPSEGELDGSNNDVYTGPYDTEDNDGDGLLNEDNVDGEDDDNDGQTDEDWAGGNSEPETKFIQDMTEMNDDDGDGASEFKATLTWHSYSELVLYPWGHCSGCETPDHAQLIYHGDKMAEMTHYTNMQSSDLYPTTGDFCDWHYGVHRSYCYTIEIGTAFHQQPGDINHIAVQNLGVPFYMIEIADDPRQRADLGISNITPLQHLQAPTNVMIPETGSVPIEFCLDQRFPISFDVNRTYLRWRFVKPSSTQSDYGPAEWRSEPWQNSPFEAVQTSNGSSMPCVLDDGNTNGVALRSLADVDDDVIGQIHYSAFISTLGGATTFYYPDNLPYYEVNIPYRAGFGSGFVAFFMFSLIALAVWGGLAICIREMLKVEGAAKSDDGLALMGGDAEFSEQPHNEDPTISETEMDEERSDATSAVPLKYSERTLNKIALEHDIDPDRLLTYAWAYDLDKNGYLNATELTAAAKALVGRRGDADIDAAIDAAGEDI